MFIKEFKIEILMTALNYLHARLRLFIIALILLIIFNVVYYIPNKLKEQEEKRALHLKELYIRLNRIESKIGELMTSKLK